MYREPVKIDGRIIIAMALHGILRVLRTLFGIVEDETDRGHTRDQAARQRIEEIVRLIRNEDWAELRRHFALPLRWLLSAAFLKKAFDLVKVSAGPVEHVGDAVPSRGWLLAGAKVPVRFRRARLALGLTLTPYGGLLGLNFVPMGMAGLGRTWEAPAYAPEKGFSEEEVEVGPPTLRVKGTLTLPDGAERCPCVVLLAGSGPMDRDSTVDACKPFKDLALGLAGQGVATLRFDKVTHTHGAKVRKNKAFTPTDEYLDHALDAVRQALAHEKIRAGCVVVLGHSLGGYVAPKLVEMETRIAGCVLMATPSVPIHHSALKQLRHFAAMDEEPTETAREQIAELEKQCELADSEALNTSTAAAQLPLGLGPAYLLDLRNFRPIETAGSLTVPVLVLQGGRDYQVTAHEDFEDWRTGLRNKPDATLRVDEKLDHLFIAGEGPSTALDYNTPGHVDEQVVREISQWIFGHLAQRGQ